MQDSPIGLRTPFDLELELTVPFLQVLQESSLGVSQLLVAIFDLQWKFRFRVQDIN